MELTIDASNSFLCKLFLIQQDSNNIPQLHWCALEITRLYISNMYINRVTLCQDYIPKNCYHDAF